MLLIRFYSQLQVKLLRLNFVYRLNNMIVIFVFQLHVSFQHRVQIFRGGGGGVGINHKGVHKEGSSSQFQF